MSKELYRDAQAFCRRFHMADTAFGRKAIGDPKLLGDLRDGRVLRPNTASRVRAFMEGWGK